MRKTIDYGIHLGTEFAAIAVYDGTRAEVIRNNENFEVTHSVVHLDKNKSLVVGRAAYERLELDPGNTFGEFKLQMGSDHVCEFERDGREMMPVELSAEILKSLKADVQQRKGEDLFAAAIFASTQRIEGVELPKSRREKIWNDSERLMLESLRSLYSKASEE